MHRARPEVCQLDVHLVTMQMGGPIQIVSSPGGVFRHDSFYRPDLEGAVRADQRKGGPTVKKLIAVLLIVAVPGGYFLARWLTGRDLGFTPAKALAGSWAKTPLHTEETVDRDVNPKEVWGAWLVPLPASASHHLLREA